MASITCAHPQKKFAGKESGKKTPNPFTAKKDSAEALFEIMDKEGRGAGSYKFWYAKTREEKIGYCKWLIEKKEIKSRTEFARNAPSHLANYFLDDNTWDEIGLRDIRIGNKCGCKPKDGSKTAPEGKAQKNKKPEKSKKKSEPKIVSFSEGIETGNADDQAYDPHSPLAIPPHTPSMFSPIRVTPPLPEPKFRYWESVSESGKEAMVEEFFQAARKGESYNLEKLLRMRIPVDVRNSSGETALMEAAQWRHTKLCRILLEHGADPCAVNKHNENALVYAKDGEREETIELIRNAIKNSSKKGK